MSLNIFVRFCSIAILILIDAPIVPSLAVGTFWTGSLDMIDPFKSYHLHKVIPSSLRPSQVESPFS